LVFHSYLNMLKIFNYFRQTVLLTNKKRFMSFTGEENHDIDLATASKWTKNYRQANPEDLKAHFFGKAAIQAILNQDNCVGIRMYYALDDLGVKHLVLVGANASENDLYNGLLAERSKPCPTICDKSGSPLNS
jgi:hypothetical protein